MHQFFILVVYFYALSNPNWGYQPTGVIVHRAMYKAWCMQEKQSLRMYTHYFHKEQLCTGLGMFFLGNMVLEWREHEHEYVDRAVLGDINAQQSLRMCGLYKFWKLVGLRSQPRLLQMFVDYWDPDTEAFILDGMPLRLEVEDIYFILGLSHRGEVVNLRTRGVGGGLTIEDYIVAYGIPNTEKIGIQVLVNVIQSLSLKVIVLVLERITGLESLHQASLPLMFYSV